MPERCHGLRDGPLDIGGDADIVGDVEAWPPASLICMTTWSNLSVRRPTRVTAAPRSASSRAVAAPIPLPAPVTSAILSERGPMLKWAGQPTQGVRAAELGTAPGAFDGVGRSADASSVVSAMKSRDRTGEFLAQGLSQAFADCVNPGL
ncbi:hypothetical protein OG466_01130 [Streptomyces sp. NBC_01240]|nr:hypothetical protein OG466_01130 [Streptomyces sp. NBC_01240]